MLQHKGDVLQLEAALLAFVVALSAPLIVTAMGGCVVQVLVEENSAHDLKANWLLLVCIQEFDWPAILGSS
jgi:hypothetical protein